MAEKPSDGLDRFQRYSRKNRAKINAKRRERRRLGLDKDPPITPERRAKNTARKKRWREANPEKLVRSAEQKAADRARQKAWIEQNKELHLANHRKWSAARRRRNGIPEQGDGMTPDELKTYRKQWAVANREKHREYSAAYKRKNPDKVKEYAAKNRETIRERNRSRMAQLRADGTIGWHLLSDGEKATHLAKCRERYAATLEKSREYSRYRAIIRRSRESGAGGSFTDEDITTLHAKQGKKCAACRKGITKHGERRFHIDHIQPLCKGGSSWPHNLQLLCRFCNLSKGSMSPEEWAKKQGVLFL